jgi:hypothetical protein
MLQPNLREVWSAGEIVTIRMTVIAVIAVTAAIAGSAMLASAADAKEEIDAFVVCGAERCRELRGDVARLSSTLTMHPGRRPSRAAPFYDVYFIFREPGGGRSTPGGALRYVPSAPAVRSHGATGEVWFRADRRLARALRPRIDGLAPRPASALDAPAFEIGVATATAQEALGAQAGAAVAPPAGSGDGPPVELVLVAALGIVAAVVGVRRLRPA